MRLSSEKQIPSRIQIYANEQHLGTPHIVYETEHSRLHLIIGPLAIFVGAAILGAYDLLYESVFSWFPTWKSLPIIGAGVIWIIVGLWMLFFPLIFPALRLFLCPKGLIFFQRKPDVLRWDQIRSVAKKIELDKRKQYKRCSYHFERNDGKRFELEDTLPHIDRLYGFIEREVARLLLPVAQARLEQSQKLDFGFIQLQNEGLELTTDQQRLTWDELKHIDSDETTISFYTWQKDWPWATLTLSDLINVYLLKELIQQIISQKQEQTIDTWQPAYIQAYEAGFTLFFGKFGLSNVGISLNGQEETLKWNDIERFGINESEIVIKRKGAHTQWYTFPLWSLTDSDTLKNLVDYILFKQYEKK